MALGVVTLLVMTSSLVWGQSFVDLDIEELEGRSGLRSLLQTHNQEEGEEGEGVEEESRNKAGPTRFFLGEQERMPKLLMEVMGGIRLTLSEGEVKDTYILDQPANGGITGSRINMSSGVEDFEDLKVSIDYKGQSFKSERPEGSEISGLLLRLMFELKRGTFKMTHLEVVKLGYKGKWLDIEFHHRSSQGYEIKAPVGLAWGCGEPGVFHSTDSEAMTRASLRFPDLQLQAFKVGSNKDGPVFGPWWECGDLISIGLWVGILVSLGFASICVWGFSMLANINTMDRFDDPKGKAIYVPQTD